MGKYILRRLVMLIPTLLGMSMLIFLMLRLLPEIFSTSSPAPMPRPAKSRWTSCARPWGWPTPSRCST